MECEGGEKGGKRGKGVIIIKNLFLVSPHGTFTFKALPLLPFHSHEAYTKQKGQGFSSSFIQRGDGDAER